MERDGRDIIRSIKAAVEALGQDEVRSLDWLELRITDPEMDILDNRLIRSAMNDRENVANIARQVVGRDDAAFDVCNFGPQSDDDIGRKVIAAVSLERVREYLSACGDLATRVKAISPSSIAFQKNATATSGQSFAIMELGAAQTQLFLAESDSGSIAKRVIPIGIRHFAEGLSEALSLPTTQTVQMLEERDMLARLRDAGPGDDRDVQAGAADRAIAAVAEPLLKEFRRTLDDFSENRLATPPERILIGSGADAIRGFCEWMTEKVGIPLEAPDRSLAERPEDDLPLNLLRGTQDPLIVKGKTWYRFRDGRFVADQTGPEQTPKVDVRTGVGRKKDNQASRKAQRETVKTEKRKKLILVLAVLALMALPVVAFDNFVAPFQQSVQRKLDILAQSEERVAALRRQAVDMSTAAAVQPGAEDEKSTKILWTEKFFAVSRAIPASIWLSDVAIIQDERSVGQTDVITTKLVLHGQTTLDDRRHLGEIADFIRHLEDNPDFMSDFRRVTFEGLDRFGDGEVSFELHAWYDRNKRKEVSGGVSEENAGPLEGLRRKTDEREKLQNNVLRLGSSAREISQ
ncbi:MAG: hypothetical protein P1U49_07885 [Minwuia sp.]|nr:hypothetical protein [Minwuia sp.]